MSQTGADRLLAGLSGLAGAAAAFFTFTVPAGVWNYSAEGASLLTGTIGGAVAAGLAVLSRKTGGSALNTAGLALGVAAFAVGAGMLLLGSYDIEFG
jgi:hypothetical protein